MRSLWWLKLTVQHQEFTTPRMHSFLHAWHLLSGQYDGDQQHWEGFLLLPAQHISCQMAGVETSYELLATSNSRNVRLIYDRISFLFNWVTRGMWLLMVSHFVGKATHIHAILKPYHKVTRDIVTYRTLVHSKVIQVKSNKHFCSPIQLELLPY